MEQCTCSYNKLGVHCYECEDRMLWEEILEANAEIGLRWSEVKQDWTSKKMCKKKTSGNWVKVKPCKKK